jgi:hypothetical protein
LTTTVKGPPTRRPSELKLPESFVVAFERVPHGKWVMVTLAPDTGAPAAVTVPWIDEVVSWA